MLINFLFYDYETAYDVIKEPKKKLLFLNLPK